LHIGNFTYFLVGKFPYASFLKRRK